MGTWLYEGFASVGLFVLLIPALLPAGLAVVYRRYHYAPAIPTLWATLTALYASALVAFTTFPLPDAPEDFCTERSRLEYWRLTPGESFGEVLDRAREVGLASTLTSGVFLQVAFNVVFFMPLGFLVAYLLRRGAQWALVAGLATSLLIEASQGSALWGLYPCPYRVAEVDDLITNTSGALLGWCLGWAIARVLPFREPPTRPDLAAPSTGRRVLAALADLSIVLVATIAIELVVVFVAELRGWDPAGARPVLVGLSIAIPTLLLLGVPLVRRDRATPGQWTVLVGLARDESGAPVGLAAPVVRFAVRWVPIMVLGTAALLVLAAAELLVIRFRPDRRSLAGMMSGTSTVTRERLQAAASGADAALTPANAPPLP